jgi:hypothetical protein
MKRSAEEHEDGPYKKKIRLADEYASFLQVTDNTLAPPVYLHLPAN